MIKKFDFEKKRTANFKALEPGGYVCKIHSAEVLNYDWGDVLKVNFDIAEGEFMDYYIEQYNRNPNEDRKWQGNIRITLPDEGNQYFESQKKKFGNFIVCVEESNPGYAWDWNEATLKDKYVGIVFGNEEYSFNGYSGWKAKPQLIVSTDDIYNNNFKVPKDKPLKNSSASYAETPAGFELVTDDDGVLPF